MEIKKVIPLVYKYYRIKRRIKRLSSLLKETEREIEKLLSNKEDESYIIINGLKWDKENLSVGGTEYKGNHYYTFDEAQECAKKVEKRCPTQKEFDNLFKLGYTWDEEKKGVWVAGNHDSDHKGSLFFPTAGLYIDRIGCVDGYLYSGFYLTSSIYDSEDCSCYLFYFDGNGITGPKISKFIDGGYCLSVRCVSELKK